MNVAWLIVGIVVVGAAQPGFAEECGNMGAPATYKAQVEDHADTKSLDASRSFAGVHELVVNACQGELRIRGTNSSAMRIEITAENLYQPLDRYLHDFTATGGSAKIDVRLPSKYHPMITISVPTDASLQSEINLGAGDLTLYAERIRGKRELNLGAGRAVVYLDRDRDYASLEANIGMGSFRDERPGSAHFVVARSMQGTGAGDLQVNVGAGQIQLEPAK